MSDCKHRYDTDHQNCLVCMDCGHKERIVNPFIAELEAKLERLESERRCHSTGDRQMKYLCMCGGDTDDMPHDTDCPVVLGARIAELEAKLDLCRKRLALYLKHWRRSHE